MGSIERKRGGFVERQLPPSGARGLEVGAGKLPDALLVFLPMAPPAA